MRHNQLGNTYNCIEEWLQNIILLPPCVILIFIINPIKRLDQLLSICVSNGGYNLRGAISADHQLSHLEVIFAIIKFAKHDMVLNGKINLRT